MSRRPMSRRSPRRRSEHARRRRPRYGIAVGLVLAALLGPLATAARAHGPTVRVGYSGVRPSQIAIEAGTTVHFHNANSGDGICTVVADDGSFESPPLARGEGWHHEFTRPGRYAFHVKEYSSAAGVILVGESADD